MEVAVWLQSKHSLTLVLRVWVWWFKLEHRTSLHQNISSVEIALRLQSVAVVDRQATFTDTFTEISSMEVALCLQSVAAVCVFSHFHRYFH